MRGIASLCPFPGVAARLQARLVPNLVSASLFISPRTYSRFFVSLLVLLSPAEALALLLLPVEQALLIVGALAMVQSTPVVVLLSRANSRRKATDSELPFFLMTLSVFVHEANPTPPLVVVERKRLLRHGRQFQLASLCVHRRRVYLRSVFQFN